MLRLSVRRATVVALMLIAAGCGSNLPSAPTANVLSGISPAPAPPAPTSPPLTGPSRVFVFERASGYPVRPYTQASRFVLYENGAFALQYVSLGVDYRGRYTEANGELRLQWADSSSDAARGVIENTSLAVEYPFVMQMSDFENAVYRLADGKP